MIHLLFTKAVAHPMTQPAFSTAIRLSTLTSTAIAVVLDVDVNRVIKVAAELFRLFLG